MANLQKAWSEQEINSVWKKATKINEKDEYRKDYAGAWIKRGEYGNRNSLYGWEIDHRKPKSKYGSDNVDNLDPLHWENNSYKGDDFPNWQTSISSSDNRNIRKIQNWEVKNG